MELIACDNIHNEVEERNLVTIIEQSNGTVKAFWAKAEYPVETDILIQVKYEVDNQLSSSVEERETILRIFKGKTTSATIFGKLRSLPLITPTEDWRYYYTDYIEM